MKTGEAVHWAVTVRLGHDHDPDKRGILIALGKYVVQLDRDGLMAVTADSIELEPINPDQGYHDSHVLTDCAIRSYLERARDGAHIDDLMREIELDEIEMGST